MKNRNCCYIYLMKKMHITKLLVLVSLVVASVSSQAQNPENWTEKQLMQPAALANAINAKADVPVIISVGPGATIPGSVVAGMGSTKEGLDKLKEQLNTLPKDTKVVIYCGCCPFEHCPNVRPAIGVLKQMQFTNYYLLNLPHNIKQDWIDKGYPVSKS